ncbi:MAG: alpha-amylase family glycosyl hydrolase, partial [Oscillospiraceae bacterium]
MRILFDSKNTEYKKPFGCIKPNHTCKICIKIPKDCQTKQVNLCLNYENDKPYKSYEMQKNADFIDENYEEFICNFSMEETGLFFYYFSITAITGGFKLFKQGLHDTNMEAGELWQLSCIQKCRRSSKDFFGKVMYQIFPDRFFQSGECDVQNKIKPFILHKNKNEIPNFAPDVKGIVQNNDFYGGNLNGIKEKLSYLKSLSVSIIYLNPIFMAYSNHRYDTANYKKIDPILGTEQDFKELCDAAHKLDMKIILDGVFSHTGEVSEYFDVNDIFGNGCFNHPNSPYREWYQFKKYPNDYESWWGIRCLPCV